MNPETIAAVLAYLTEEFPNHTVEIVDDAAERRARRLYFSVDGPTGHHGLIATEELLDTDPQEVGKNLRLWGVADRLRFSKNILVAVGESGFLSTSYSGGMLTRWAAESIVHPDHDPAVPIIIVFPNKSTRQACEDGLQELGLQGYESPDDNHMLVVRATRARVLKIIRFAEQCGGSASMPARPEIVVV